MWTAKRFLILVVSLLGALGSYGIYALFLGLIDGVQPLPFEKLPQPGSPVDPRVSRPESEADKKLKEGYGPACKELQLPLRLWLPDKGIAFAAGEFQIGPSKSDGKIRLSPFSAAFHHKRKGPNGFPEISTIRCEMAILTLDRPVTQLGELNNRKITKVEMVGRQPNNITLTNNRGTEQKSDDLDILITNGHLFYVESDDHIYTEGVVCMTDHQPRPPTVICGRGLDLYLAKANVPKGARPAKSASLSSPDASNVEKIALRSDVDMKFWTDSRSGFLGAPSKPAPASTAGKRVPAEKELIHIHTGGPFVYDLTKEIAWFESPRPRDSKPGKGAEPFAPDQVHVHRVQKANGGEKFDQLTCDRLDLQFRRKPPTGPGDAGGDKEIETAKATRRDVNEVTLSLDSEGMAAFGHEMFYRAGDAVNGPLTILKGEPHRPLRTFKDGHAMRSQELHLFSANRFGDGQHAWAKGPGAIDMIDASSPGKNSFPTHVNFRDTLTVVKVKEGSEVFDLITVLGEASFIDDAQKQELHGDKLMVWVRQVQESARKPDAVGGARQELHRVIAQGRVRASSPDFIVKRSDELTMAFRNEHARGAILPEVIEPKQSGPKTTIDGKDVKIDNKGAPIVPKLAVEEKKAPARPIELDANKITVAVFTLGNKKQLDELIANGNVYVFQAGEKPGQKAMDITGARLTVHHFERGDTMIVFGDKDKPARVEADDTIIVGRRITVNQADNRADVDGAGAMELPSNKNIDGTLSAKKASRLTIHWKKNMNFDGKYAVFQGGVQIHENGTRNGALCDVLTAILDQQVSFKDGKKDKQSARLDRLVFDKNVYVQEVRYDDQKTPQLLQYNKMQGWILYNREDGPTHVTGPGWVKMLARGAAETGLMKPDPGVSAKPAPKHDWKLTHVRFTRSMDSNSKAEFKKTTFYGENGGVEVFHFPTLDIDSAMDPDRPPENGVYLRCGQLVVEGKQDAGRTTQIMIGQHNVYFRTDKYAGYADIIKYVENTDTVILEATNGKQVRLYEVVPGKNELRQSNIQSSKVLYNRKTGKIDTEGVKSIQTN